MKQFLYNSARLLWILAKASVLAWFLMRHMTAPTFVYSNF